MLEIAPMPCCGTKPPEPTSKVEHSQADGFLSTITDTTDWSSFGWDVETGLCKACGADGLDYRCASPTCKAGVAKEERFCEGCQGAFDLAMREARNEREAEEARAASAEMEKVLSDPGIMSEARDELAEELVQKALDAGGPRAWEADAARLQRMGLKRTLVPRRLDLHPKSIEVEHLRSPGDHLVNQESTGVRLTHTPTGLTAESTMERSRTKNLSAATGQLRDAVVLFWREKAEQGVEKLQEELERLREPRER